MDTEAADVGLETRLARVEVAAAALRRAEEQAARRRATLYDEIRAAQAAGASVSALARSAGVSRQRMQRLLREL